jgi:hypothetical protein
MPTMNLISCFAPAALGAVFGIAKPASTGM